MGYNEEKKEDSETVKNVETKEETNPEIETIEVHKVDSTETNNEERKEDSEADKNVET